MTKCTRKLGDIIKSPISDNFYDLKINKSNVIFYGFGQLGQMALKLLSIIDIKPKYIIDQKVSIQNNSNIIKPDDINTKDLNTAIFVICISSISYNEIHSYLKKIGCRKIIHFYDLAYILIPYILSNGWEKFNPTQSDLNEINNVILNLNHDKYSLNHYFQFLWWKLRRIETIDKSFPVLSNKKYFDAPCFPKLKNNESFLDIGAHNGTTINHFIKNSDNKFEKIWAYEPDEKNFKDLKRFENNPKILLSKTAISNFKGKSKFIDNLGFASKLDKEGKKEVLVDKIDNLNLNPTIIKIHIEGAELHALKGAEKTIQKNRPIIMVLADHNEDGLFQIANFLLNLENYKLYFYLHDYCGNSAIYYAIPKERVLNE